MVIQHSMDASSPYVVKVCHIGLGVFATRELRRGEVVGEIRGTVFDDPEYFSDYCMDLGDERTLEPAPPFRHLNHSCSPTCELVQYDDQDRLWVSVCRNIKRGEQLTIDYAWPAEQAIPCRCGSEECRGFVVDKTELREAVATSA